MFILVYVITHIILYIIVLVMVVLGMGEGRGNRLSTYLVVGGDVRLAAGTDHVAEVVGCEDFVFLIDLVPLLEIVEYDVRLDRLVLIVLLGLSDFVSEDGVNLERFLLDLLVQLIQFMRCYFTLHFELLLLNLHLDHQIRHRLMQKQCVFVVPGQFALGDIGFEVFLEKGLDFLLVYNLWRKIGHFYGVV